MSTEVDYIINEVLPEDWQAKFLEHYDQGASDWEIMREFGITPKQWKVMIAALDSSEFNEVVEYGHALARAWWENQGRVNLRTRGFNVRLFDINMQNRYNWAQKEQVNELDRDPTETADEKAIDERIKRFMRVEGDNKELVSGASDP